MCKLWSMVCPMVGLKRLGQLQFIVLREVLRVLDRS